jgi:copper chaperone CopZ
MTYTYQLTGMTCSGCETTIASNLISLADVTSVEPIKENNTVTITMKKHIQLSVLQDTTGQTH